MIPKTFAKKTPGSHPVRLHLFVRYGDKDSQFLLKEEKKKFYLIFNSNQGFSKRIAIKAKDASYLISKAGALPQKQESQSGCHRSFIYVSSKKGKASTCLQSRSQTAKKLLELANLLSTVVDR